ncbi:DUF1707 SHOCT-like domain-containing protein [Amycolatopsis sp. CA-230715]|uniref:DUF1707 SHOCT-like domain-containing protein n=1 Tax=Amycolatopsis sp. CA-230715 TaxID=2745196 RepID=UPI001C022CBF|nr:DUF1707 domain-containing protein [Amycolatopsis sp. CA-230715]QWF80513.1 hypothetical protein HUW46_03936 [Amycolatopsis sp. CA-230715]
MGEDQAETAVSTKPLNPRDLRVSDAEREHVVAVLEKAIGRGLIDLDEFTERTDTALAARTRGELNVVLADLPGLVHRDAVVPGTPPAAANFAGERLELKAHGSNLVRKGRWSVPGNLSVLNKYGNTTLDFTQAAVASPVVNIELSTKWGSVELIIPEQAAVDVNSVTEVKWGALNDRTNTNGHAGTPRYVVSGRVHGGSLTIRHPKRGLFG